VELTSRTVRSRCFTTGLRMAAAALGMLCVCVPVLADVDEPLQEVVVTAQKREQNLQDVPLTISALTGSDFENKGMSGFRDWADDIPGIKVTQGSSANRRAGPTAVIRGVSQSNAGQLNEVSAMATTGYTFGQVPVNSGDPGLFDLNRIEVLRGPQGTLFGLASMGGTVRFIPNEARLDAFSGEVTGGGGTIDHGGLTHDLAMMVNVPIVQDVLAVRFAAQTRHQDGFIDLHILPLTSTDFTKIRVDGNTGFDPRLSGSNSPGNIKNANSSTTSAARVSITYKPTERLELKAFAMTQTATQATKQDIDYNDSSQGWVATRFAPEPQENQFRIFSLEGSYDLGFGALNYVFGSQYRSQSETIDFTALAPALLSGAVPALQKDPALPPDPLPSPTVFPFFSQNRVVSNELRLQGQNKPLFSSPVSFDYVFGVFDMSEKASGHWEIANPQWNADKGPNTVPILTAGGLILGQNGGGDFRTKAVFGDLTLNLTRKLSVGGGVRYSHDTRTSALPTYGDSVTGLAANGATVGSDLNGPGEIEGYGNASDSSVTPRGTASYRIDDDRMLYFTAAKGQRSPQSFANAKFFDDIPTHCRALARSLGLESAALEGTKSDIVWSYDLGLKGSWLDRRLVIDAALYDVRWSDLQLNVLLNQFDASCQAIIAANVGQVDIRGVELSARYAPVDSLIFTTDVASANSGLTHDVPGVTSSLGTPLKKGDEVTSAPRWTVNASAMYTFPVPFLQQNLPSLGGEARGFGRVDWRYVGERFDESLGNRDALRADPVRSFYVAAPYTLTDIRAGITTSKYSGSIYCSNLFDQRAMYASHQTIWYPNQRIVSVSQPRTIGFELKLTF
jgi:iron complex outermembrane recepter protein